VGQYSKRRLPKLLVANTNLKPKRLEPTLVGLFSKGRPLVLLEPTLLGLYSKRRILTLLVANTGTLLGLCSKGWPLSLLEVRH
jgi:hypothetical protein